MVKPEWGTKRTCPKCGERFYDLGMKPDWWKLEPNDSAAAWANIERTVARNDPRCRGVVLLGAPLNTVEVAFLDRTSPNRIPERMQLWMAAVEDGGGQVKVTPPAAPFGTRSPVMLIGAIASLWSASKAVSEMAQKAQYERAKRYNAEVILKLEQGETVIDRIVFSQKP